MRGEMAERADPTPAVDAATLAMRITLNLADRIQKMPLVKAAFATGALAESAAEGFA